MIRQFYSYAKRFAQSAQLRAVAVKHKIGQVSATSSHVHNRMTPLLPRFHFMPTVIRDKWLPLAGDIEGIPEFRTLDRRLMIMCSSRTGSEYLSYLLEDFGFDIHEYFNDIERCVDMGFSAIRDYIIDLLNKPQNRMFGVKGTGQSSLPLFLYDEWPRYAHEWKVVRLLRRNVVRQAVSLRIAEKSQAWRAERVPQRVVREDEYNFEEILRCLDDIATVNGHIERIISLSGVRALTVFYEDLSDEPHAVTDAVGRYLEVDRISTRALEGGGFTRPTPTVQSTDLNKLWEQRFREDLARYSSAEEIRRIAA